MNPLEPTTNLLFFTGKGGVGKTALPCATSIGLADSGRRVLLVSTDPASNLDEMLGGRALGPSDAVPGVENLFPLNIDPEEAAESYRQRVVSAYVPTWSEQQLSELREQLSGSCTVEIAAFDEFAGLLAGEEFAKGFDRIVFDTAPTGHTPRLLSLPKAWTEFLQTNTRGASCLGLHSAGDRVCPLAGAEAALPAEVLQLDAGSFGVGPQALRIVGSVRLGTCRFHHHQEPVLTSTWLMTSPALSRASLSASRQPIQLPTVPVKVATPPWTATAT